MVVKLLGIGDVLSGLVFLLLHLNISSLKLVLLVSAYLIIKGISFKSFLGFVDVVLGIYIWLVFFGFHTFLDYIILIYLVQKGVSSLL